MTLLDGEPMPTPTPPPQDAQKSDGAATRGVPVDELEPGWLGRLLDDDDPLESVIPSADDPRARARNTDPWTSHAAAASVQEIRASQQAVLRVFAEVGPMHDVRMLFEYRTLARELGLPAQSDSGLRTRRSELVESGRLRDSGRTVTLPSGRKAIVWEQVPSEEVTLL